MNYDKKMLKDVLYLYPPFRPSQVVIGKKSFTSYI